MPIWHRRNARDLMHVNVVTPQHLNALIDAALLDAAPRRAWLDAPVVPVADPERLAEHIRRRATRIARRVRARSAVVLDARDDLIQALYARDTPPGWCTAWCDGATSATGAAGVGGLLVDAEGRVIGRWSRTASPHDPLGAEIAALAATLAAATGHGVDRLRVYSDCVALVRLWHEHRADARLRAVRRLAGRLARLQLRALPRLHNQPAHRLARAALGRASGSLKTNC